MIASAGRRRSLPGAALDSMRRRYSARRLGFVVTLYAAHAVAQAQVTAEGDDTARRAIAEMLFRQGRELMDQGQVATACSKFDESLRLDPVLGTLLNLAVCREREGRLATAWAEYNRAGTMARRAGDEARAEFARQGAARLDELLATLRISPAPELQGVSGLSLELDGRKLGEAAFDTPIPLDSGSHVVIARAPGYEEWSTTLQVSAQTRAMALTVPALAKRPTPASMAPPPSPPPQATLESPRLSPEPRADAGRAQRIWGLSLAGAGLVGVTVGAVFGVRALVKKSDRDERCPGNVCSSPAGIADHRDARGAASAANVAFAVGGVLLVTGGLLYLTVPSAASAPTPGPKRALLPTRQVKVAATTAGGLLTLEGSW